MSNTDVVSLIVSMISSDFTELIIIIGALAGITIVVRLLLTSIQFGQDTIV